MSDPIAFDAGTPRHGLPLLFPGQAQKEFFVNEALTRLDALVQPIIKGVRDTPPESPVAGESWIVGPAPGGAWAGYADALATWGDGWRFVRAVDGMHVHDLDRSAVRVYRDGWRMAEVLAEPKGGSIVDAEARGTIVALLQALREITLIPSVAPEPRP